MKVSKDKLQEMITLYLNDIEDYGTSKEFLLAESTLSPYKQLITENKKPVNELIKEMISSSGDSVVIADFLDYIREI
jgi:hypothetical protein